MLSLPASVRIFVAVEPCDMRKGFDSLAAIVRERFGDDPLSGHLFVFRSRRGDRMKILWWDRDGYAIWQKRLERGVFRLPRIDPSCVDARLDVSRREFAMMLEGIDAENAKKLRRYACALPRRVVDSAQHVA